MMRRLADMPPMLLLSMVLGASAISTILMVLGALPIGRVAAYFLGVVVGTAMTATLGAYLQFLAERASD